MSGVCLSSFLAVLVPGRVHSAPRSFTHVVPVLFVPASQGQNTQSDRTNISFLASWSSFTDAGCATPVMDVFASSLITWGMGVLVDVGAHHIHRSSSLVFSRLRLFPWVGSSASVLFRALYHLGSARPRVPLVLSDAHPNPCLRQPVNNSCTPPANDCPSRMSHSRRSYHPPHGSRPHDSFSLTSPLPVCFVFVRLRPEHVSHTPCST